MKQEAYWYWLSKEFYVQRKWIFKFLKYFGTPENLWKAKEEELVKIEGEKTKKLQYFLDRRQKESPLEVYEKFCAGKDKFYSLEHPEYPLKLKSIEDRPMGLFVRGKLPEMDRMSVAIIGSRDCSSYGRNLAERFGKVLSESGVQVISGMALGVDSWGHEGALKGRTPTYAVLGGGVDVCYPRQNIGLYHNIQKKGGILSESPLGMRPHAFLFPMRNRIISGLSDAVIIIEAREKSGTFITADCALEQGKDVYAVPGRIGEDLSRGCNKLIKEGAGILLSEEDLLEELDILGGFSKKERKKEKNLLESSHKLVYSCLSLKAKGLNQICEETNLSVLEVMQVLITLELKGYIKETEKNYFSLQ